MSDAKLNRRDMAAMVALAAAFGAAPAEAAAQPNMEKALEYCEAALSRLEAAKNNKGGHRVTAIKHLKFVIQEIKAGIDHAS